MFYLKKDTGEVVETENVELLSSWIPEKVKDSLARQVSNEGTLNRYLEDFINQGRVVAASALGEDVSTAVLIMHWKENDELPGDRGYADWVMFHYLTPDAHVSGGRGSAIWEAAKDAIATAQHQFRFNGAAVLGLYSAYIGFFGTHRIEAGAPEKLTELAAEASEGSGVDVDDPGNLETALRNLPGGKPFIMPFGYGAHQTYIRASYNEPRYRLEYFDRQRQTLTLKGKEIPGYLQGPEGTDMVDGKPVCFDFELDPKELASICKTASSFATGPAQPGETLVNASRQKVLEEFAAKSKDVAVFGEPEPGQHPDAINCPWASLESIIRFFVGSAALQKQVEFIREVAVTLYIAEHGKPEEKEAAGLAVVA